LFPLLGFPQQGASPRTNDTVTVQLVGTVAVDLPGKGTTLFWSEEGGYVKLQRKGNLPNTDLLKFPKHQFRATGQWNQDQARTLNLHSISPIETSTVLPPPIDEAPVDLSKRHPGISRVYLEGTVIHCHDRTYSLQILMEVNEQPVIFFVRSGNTDMRALVQAGRRLGITGYLWHHQTSNPGKIPTTIVASKKSELHFFGQDPPAPIRPAPSRRCNSWGSTRMTWPCSAAMTCPSPSCSITPP